MTEHDTVIVTQPDSATLWALVRCDSLGRVLVERLDAERGRRASITPSVVADGGSAIIKAVATADPQSVIVRRREVSRSHSRSALSSTSERTEARATAAGNLRRHLTAVALFLIGAAAGYILKTLRP